MNLAPAIFWLCIFVIFYTYIGYAVIALLIGKFRSLIVKSDSIYDLNFEPEITLVIPCYNEFDVLKNKVQNCFDLDYPKNKLHIIFICDGSDDGSEKLLNNIEGITVLFEPNRLGKSAAENRAMQFVKTPFVVFCDANTIINKSAIREIVKHYKNERVGAVAGEKRIINNEKDTASAAGEAFYWRYESFLKRIDSNLYSTIGGAGELVSFRTSLYTTLETDTILDDFMQSMRIALKGYKVVYEPNAFAEETASVNVSEELKRKIRISAGAWQAMSRLGNAFNPFHNVQLTFLFFSHKVIRWTLAPLAILFIIPINIYLNYYSDSIYNAILFLQIIFYIFTILGWFFEHQKIRFKLFYIPYYFFVTNLCMYLGFFRFLNGNQSVKWEHAKRAIYIYIYRERERESCLKIQTFVYHTIILI